MRSSTIILTVSCFGGLLCSGQTPEPDDMNRCHAARLNVMTAWNVGDWEGVLSTGEAAIRICQSKGKAESAPILESIANSYLILNRADEALKASNECISLVYKNVYCHTIKVFAYDKKAMRDRARDHAILTKKICELILEPLNSVDVTTLSEGNRIRRNLDLQYATTHLREMEKYLQVK